MRGWKRRACVTCMKITQHPCIPAGAQNEVEKAQCLPALLSLQEAGSTDERLGAMGCLAQLLPAAGGPGALMVLEQVHSPLQRVLDLCSFAAGLPK